MQTHWTHRREHLVATQGSEDGDGEEVYIEFGKSSDPLPKVFQADSRHNTVLFLGAVRGATP